MKLNVLDIIIFSGYFVILLFIGFWSGRKKNKKATDFFLTSKTLPWYVIGFSIIAAGISSEQFLGTVGFAYNYGLSVANWEWLNGPAILLLTFIFIPFYMRRKVITMPHFLELRYNGKIRTLFAIITILTYVFINMAGVIFSGGYALNKIFGLDLYVGIWGMSIIAGSFTIYGGMESVAWTNVFQSILLLGSGLLIFFIGLFIIPGGINTIIGEGTRSHLILPADDPEIPWTGLIILMISTNVWFFCTNQTINQAALGAKNEWHARIGVLFAGFLAIAIAFADAFPGLIAYVLNPNLEASDDAYPYVVNHLIPAGLKGLVFAGLCGAIISTIEALANASSTIFSFDIYKRWINKNANDKQIIFYGRIVGAAVLIIGTLWAPIVMRFGHIFSYFQECWAFIAIPIAIIFVVGVLWDGLTDRSAFWTLLLSFPMLILPYVLRTLEVDMNVFNVAGFVLVFTLLFTISTSLLTRKEKKSNLQDYIWNISMLKIPKNIFPGKYYWFRKVGFWAIVMIVAYMTIYFIFW
jgi:SSS family solute:Na+ symporter